MSTPTEPPPTPEFAGRTWTKDILEAHYRREGSRLWYVCKVQRGNEFVSKVDDLEAAKTLITDWAKAARGATMDVSGLTLSFPPNMARYEFRIVRTVSRSTTIEHVPL